MVEVEQEEIERLRAIETSYTELTEKHSKLEKDHATLKDEYIELSRHAVSKPKTETSEFDAFCKNKFGK